MKKYIKCFSDDKANELEMHGFIFLYKQNGVFYFENNESLTTNFSNNELFNDTKQTTTLNF
jgi:hypothetical protein